MKTLDDEFAGVLIRDHPADAAAALEGLPAADAAAILAEASPKAVARVFEHMSPHQSALTLELLAPDHVVQVLTVAAVEFGANLLRRTNAEFRQSVLSGLDGDTGAALRTILDYPLNTAATLMDPNILALPGDRTAEDAIARIRASPKHVLYNVYVVDRQHVLMGVLNLRELLLQPPDKRLSEAMRRDTFRVAAAADRNAIVRHPGWREAHSLPVVDKEGRLLGALRYRTMRRLERELHGSDRERTAVTALGDLFWTGMAGVLEAVTGVVGHEAPNKKGDHVG